MSRPQLRGDVNGLIEMREEPSSPIADFGHCFLVPPLIPSVTKHVYDLGEEAARHRD